MAMAAPASAHVLGGGRTETADAGATTLRGRRGTQRLRRGPGRDLRGRRGVGGRAPGGGGARRSPAGFSAHRRETGPALSSRGEACGKLPVPRRGPAARCGLSDAPSSRSSRGRDDPRPRAAGWGSVGLVGLHASESRGLCDGRESDRRATRRPRGPHDAVVQHGHALHRGVHSAAVRGAPSGSSDTRDGLCRSRFALVDHEGARRCRDGGPRAPHAGCASPLADVGGRPPGRLGARSGGASRRRVRERVEDLVRRRQVLDAELRRIS